MAVAFVTGMQGDDPRYYRVISTPQHYAVHSGPEATRHFADADVSKHNMEDTYVPVFRAAVVEGHAGSVMCAYDAINGAPACANPFLLEHTLRGAWQFQGYVVSDCGAVRDIFEGHHYRPTQPQASAISPEQGMDNECIDFFAKVKDDHDYRPYIEAVRQGYLSERAVDAALIRLFTARIRRACLTCRKWFRIRRSRRKNSTAFCQRLRDLAIRVTQGTSSEHTRGCQNRESTAQGS